MVQAIPKPLTFEDYLEQYPDNGGIYELINGEMVEVNPTGSHEEVVAYLVAEMNFEIRRQQLTYFLPRTCTIKPNTPNTAYKPDIVVLDRAVLAAEPLWEKASTITRKESAQLIIEVVSTNWRDDYGRKLTDYEEFGIAEYWIVDFKALGATRYIGSPKVPTVSVYGLIDGEYQVSRFRGSDRILSAIFPGLQITAEQILTAAS